MPTGGAHENMRSWDPEEDEIILHMVETVGPKWKKIIERLPGRTIASVRNRFQRIEKGRALREKGAIVKNRCHACGQPRRGHICYAKIRGGPQVEITPRPSPTLAPMMATATPMIGMVSVEPSPTPTLALPSPTRVWADVPTASNIVVDVKPRTSFLPDGTIAPVAIVPAAAPAPARQLDVVEAGVLPGLARAEVPALARSNSSIFKTFIDEIEDVSARPQPPQLTTTPLPPQLGCSVSSFMREFIDASAQLTSAPTA